MKTIKIISVGSLVFLLSTGLAQELGKRVGPQFLFLSSSTRGASLADASLAIIDDFSGFGSNPSNLGMLKKSSIDYSIHRIQQGVTFEHIGFVYKATSVEAISFNFEVLHQGGADFYTDETVRKLGYEARTGIAYGRLLTEDLSAGIDLQAITSTTGPNSVWALGGNIGLTYAPGRNIRYALMLKGLGSDYKVPASLVQTDRYESRITKVLALGLAFDFPFDDHQKSFLLALQNDKILGEKGLLYRIGVEYSLLSFGNSIRFNFRGGFIIRGLDIAPRCGIGLGVAKVSFDYSYGYLKSKNQPSHSFSLSYKW